MFVHKNPVEFRQKYVPMRLGISAIVEESKLDGGVEMCSIPTGELRRADPKVNAAVYDEHPARLPAYASLRQAVRWLTESAARFRDASSPISDVPR